MDALRRFALSLRVSPRRAAALEFALVAPAITLLAAGIFGWTAYYRLAGQVQTVADHALAAALREAREPHREPIAIAAAASEAAALGLSPERLDLVLEGAGAGMTLRLAYDASGAQAFRVASVLPMPSTTIVRLAEAPGLKP
jgi:Flp pilus assembly protein TadG